MPIDPCPDRSGSNLPRLVLPLFPVALTLFSGLIFTGCAESLSWKDGDSCTQLGRDREDIVKLEAKLEKLRTEYTGNDGEGTARLISALEMRREDLQRSDRRLAGNCRTLDYYPREAKELRPGEPRRGAYGFP